MEFIITIFHSAVIHGSSIDWAKGVAKIKYTFAPELRNHENESQPWSLKGKHFIVPSDHLIPAGEETWEAIKAAVKEVCLFVSYIY